MCLGAGEDSYACALEIEGLMNHLKNMPTHWTPFGHTAITLHMKAPLFVARQLGKHQTGLVWNEVSRRYVSDEPEFYTPEVWRKAAANVKQGSSDEAVTDPDYSDANAYVTEVVEVDLYKCALDTYKHILGIGVCPEQARMVLPQSMYTEWYWTGNLYAFANVFIQRTDSHAQKETQEIAHQIGSIISPLFPVSWKALTQ
jgi:thymidylate synthase (FAD)